MRYLRAYNESFNNESTLREALEIYAEDLPFGVDIMDIVVKYVPSYKSYVITYEHIDADLKLFSKIMSDRIIGNRNFLVTTILSDDEKIQKQKDLIKEVLLDKVDVVFSRFAKKYDMIYVPSEIAYIPADGDSVDVRFELKQLTRQRIKPQNESYSQENLIDQFKIELEDCTEFEVESIEPYNTIRNIGINNLSILQLVITEDFSLNSEVRKMIDEYIISTERFSAEKVEFADQLKYAIYDEAKQINTKIFTKMAKKYDISDLDIYVSGHSWKINETYTIKIWVSGKI